jgi:hypothetical protein
LAVDEAVAAPLEAELPEGVPLAEPDVAVAAVVGAGGATSKERQIRCHERGHKSKMHTSRSFDLKIGALCKHLGRVDGVYERDSIPCSLTKCHVGHGD